MKTSHTVIIKAPPNVAAEKIPAYESLWTNGTPL